MTDQQHKAAPEERPETHIRFAEGSAGVGLLPDQLQAGRQHHVHPVNPV
jgi:hypothetical protein